MSGRTKVFVESIPLVEERPSGVGHVLLGLVSALAANSEFQKKYELVLLAPKRGLPKLDRWPGLRDCTRRGLPIKMRILSGLMKFHLLPPMDLIFGRGIYLFGNFKNWPVTKKSVSYTYLHDIAYALFPETVSPPLQKMLITKMPRYMAQSDYVVTVSESSRREIIDFYHLDPAKVVVLYNGVDTAVYNKRSAAEVEAVKRRLGIDKPYFLFVGNIEPRKNLSRLIEAFQQLPKENYALVLVGGSGWLNQDVLEAIATARAKGFSIIKPSEYVIDEDVARLMTGAEALVHPAIHEGFGMPPAEALATQTPVLAADIPSLREVLGDDGQYFDPYNVASIAKALQDFTKLSQGQKTALTEKGILRVQEFNWDVSARKLMESMDSAYSRDE